MSLDGFTIRAMVHELNPLLCGGRITKIYQPGTTEILLHIRASGKNHKLLLSAHPAYARVQLTHTPIENPKEPPVFCMMMRKHIEGSIIQSITQIDLERILQIDLRTRNEWGGEGMRRLVVEMMGRHSNLILLDPLKGIILDGIRRVSHAISRHRQIFPGAPYLSPPEQQKQNPLEIDRASFIAGFTDQQAHFDQQLVNRFRGMGPLLAQEILEQAGAKGGEAVWQSFARCMQKAKNHQYEPTITQTEAKSVFSVWPLTHLQGEARSFPSVSEGLDRFFQGKAARDRLRQQTQELTRKLKQEIAKNAKKIAILQTELAQSQQADQYRIYGELLTTSLHQIQRGEQTTQIVNYYDEHTPTITIPLDPLLTPTQNAQRYFKKYHKLKAAKKWNVAQISKAQAEMQYLASVWVQLENASLGEVEQIREELAEEGWCKVSRKKEKQTAKKKPLPTSIHASDGTPILVGKNNKQNDYLTHQLAAPSDTWLHTKDIPGSHVVIRAKRVSERTLYEAAMIAAYYSKARQSSQVPVDFTLVKHVKKPAGARPGFATYDHQQTLFVTPHEEVIQKLTNPSSHPS
jgi:predicted ribosome quality control (RQC) complex YloA/Tae2 family protein